MRQTVDMRPSPEPASPESASPEQAAAIAAAIERFLADTLLPACSPAGEPEGWARAALLEGVAGEFQGDVPDPWINT